MIRFLVSVPRPYAMMSDEQRLVRKRGLVDGIPPVYIGADGRPCERDGALEFCFRLPTMADRIRITRECERIAAEIDTDYPQPGEAWANLNVHISQTNAAIRRHACAILKIPLVSDMAKWEDEDRERYFAFLDNVDDALLDSPQDEALLALNRLMKHANIVSSQIMLIEECAEWTVTQQVGPEWAHIDTCPAWAAYSDELLDAWRTARRSHKMGFRQPSVS